MDFQLVMGLLGVKQDVLLYQVGENNTQSGIMLSTYHHAVHDAPACSLGLVIVQ